MSMDAILRHNFMDSIVYSGLVTDFELAVFSAIVYKSVEQHNEAIQLSISPEDKWQQWWITFCRHGWQIFDHKVGEDGFRAIAYIHDVRKQIVIAFRGTERTDKATLWADWKEVCGNMVGSYGKQAFAFTEKTKEKLKLSGKAIMPPKAFQVEAYNLIFTGHSLGAWVASIMSSVFKHLSVVFDSPGAKNIIKEYRLGKIGTSLSDTEEFLILNYLTKPNLINTAHPQIGKTIELTTEADRRSYVGLNIKEWGYTQQQHNIELIVEAFNPATGMPFLDRIKEAKVWPHGGVEAAKQLIELFPQSLKDGMDLLCQWWFTRDTTYTNWANLGKELITDLLKVTCDIPSILMKITTIFKTAYGISSYDYPQFRDEVLESFEEIFEQRFKGHYHVVDFDPQSLPALFFHNSLVDFLKRAENKRACFPEKYKYMKDFELVRESSRLDIISEVKLQVGGMTAIDLRRELMKDFPRLLEYLKEETFSHSFTEECSYSYGIPTLTPKCICRKESYQKLQGIFENSSNGIPKIVAIFSPGGMGKTQLAIQFAREVYIRGTYEVVIWIAAGDSLQNTYANFTQELLGDKTDTIGVEAKISAVSRELSKKYKSILFIFDNVKSYEEISPYLAQLPVIEHMHVLLTVQDQQLAGYYEEFALCGFKPEEASEYIKINLASITSMEKENSILRLAEAADFHPLSLSIFTAYIRAQNIRLEEFHKRYESKKIMLQKIMLNHPNAAQGKAILFSIEAIASESLLARQLLNICAFLAADNIEQKLLEAYFSDISVEEITRAWQILTRYSFVNANSHNPGHLYTHRFLQNIVRNLLDNNQEDSQVLYERLLKFFVERVRSKKDALVLPNLAISDKDNIKQIFIHAEILCGYINPDLLSKEVKESYANLLSFIGIWSMGAQQTIDLEQEKLLWQSPENSHNSEKNGKKHNAIKATLFFEKASQIYRDIGNHAKVVVTLNNSGIIYYNQGDYLKARDCFDKALKIEKITNEDRIMCLINLCAVLSRQGNDAKAKQYVKQALELCEVVYGANEHLNKTRCLNILGIIYLHKADYVKATKYCEKALEMCKSIHKTNIHPDIAMCFNSLGSVFYHDGNYLEAQKCFEHSLAIYQTIYMGRNNSKVAMCLNGLANICAKQGDNAKAEQYFKEALEIYRNIHGTDNHPDMVGCLNGLSELFHCQRNYKEAIECLEKSLVILRFTHGNDNHPNIAMILSNLGIFASHLGDYPNAIEFINRALRIYSSLYKDNDHPDIARCFHNLSLIFAENGGHFGSLNCIAESMHYYTEAKKYCGHALAIYRKIYKNTAHPDMLRAFNNLIQIIFRMRVLLV